ncbi:PDZ domain-containing protein [Chitinophaga sp. Cy-1792]|uniref:PDZ domain-containing protein n=1 Tax=Chitinophaga sp. Cy-1792 TaxID=2608339 RepID=UPI0014217C08|nr:PDZ domain-containing protein [Chitinophaga sp. Cy-1792]NIG52703.1 PDZ domain-containing protein [Chitinophaga sp. Cy-1792]
MSKLLQTLSIAGFTCFSLLTTQVHAQQAKDKLGEFDELIIKRKSDKDGKVTVEIKNGDIFIDGKKVDQYNNPDISVYHRRITPLDGNRMELSDLSGFPGMNFYNGDDDDDDESETPSFNIKPNKALLGVLTEKSDAAGVTVKTVSPGSPAEKAGIRTGDIITKIDDKKIAEPKELYETIGTYKPGDKVTVTYTRNKKESKANITLDERKTAENGNSIFLSPPSSDRSNRDFFNFRDQRPRQGFGQGFGDDSWAPRGSNNVRLGLQVTDTEDGKGAKVTNIDEGSAAEKAGFKTDDIVTEFAGTPVKSARDVANAYRSNQQKSTVTAKVIRNGVSQTLEVKVPKRLNKVNL